MRVSEQWLREWVDPQIDTDTLAEQFTNLGHEVDGVEDVAAEFSNIVVGKVLKVERHPDADKLSVCSVDPGNGETLQIVCGAPNVRADMKVAVALVGAKLADGLKIRKARLRGVESQGMICSSKELGLGEDADGIMGLNPDAPNGADFREYMKLDDRVIKLDLNANRGDCFGIAGVAREIGTLNAIDVSGPDLDPVEPVIDDSFPIVLKAPEGCPSFSGRVIRGIDPDATTPDWICERLRRAGLRPISPVVDTTNYVMLELGQPMHAFDLSTLAGGIVVRYPEKNEKITLLDGREVEIDEDVLIVADHERPRALGGIMGGDDSGVGEQTTDIFFEAAFWTPLVMAGKARRFGLHTDASMRFERGVDPRLQATAIERATRLLIDIAGGQPGPVITSCDEIHMPKPAMVKLRRDRITSVLGITIPDEDVAAILTRLGMDVGNTDDGWTVLPPSHRFDIAIEEDLIEEVARVHGYDKIPEINARVDLELTPFTEQRIPINRARDALVARGYQEAITYSFVDDMLQKKFEPDLEGIVLSNPIASDMAVMRTSLWPGLVEALISNLSRQQNHVRLFEVGLKYLQQDNEIKEIKTLAAVVAGSRYPEQWASKPEANDLFDIKADIDAFLSFGGRLDAFSYAAGSHPALCPGQTAELKLDGQGVGWLGPIHPALVAELDLTYSPMLFDVDIDRAFVANVPVFEPISKYPIIRRDLAFVVDENVDIAAIEATVRDAAGPLLQRLKIFDIYRGKGIDSGRKSVALGLILQETSRTLTDEDADGVTQAVSEKLAKVWKAKIRD